MRLILTLALGATVFVHAGGAQSASWSRVGGLGVEAGLAGLAGAPVSQVAFTLDAGSIVVRTAGGRRWISPDRGETWNAVSSTAPAAVIRPEIDEDAFPPPSAPDARVVRHPSAGRLYALGEGLWTSYDGGETWTTLAENGEIIGGPQADIAFDPMEPERIFVANANGLWRSEDGGLSWSSLNSRLPNFPRARFAGAELKLTSALLGGFESVGGEWSRVSETREEPELPLGDRLRAASPPLAAAEGVRVSYRVWKDGSPISGDLTECGERDCGLEQFHRISAFASAGGRMIAGTNDGRLWLSPDGGQTWQRTSAGLPPADAGRGVVSVWVDSDSPATAAAIFSGPVGGRVFRTVDGGAFWDDMTADLPQGALSAVAGSVRSSALYVAGSTGVFYAPANLLEPAPPASWRNMTETLPGEAVSDLRLDQRTGRLYAALEEFGVYETRAPGVTDRLRLLNAADLTRRAAAPGGLLTVQGAAVTSARVNGLNAPVLAATATESQIQAPYQARGREVTVELSFSGGAEALRYPFDEVAPAIFVDRGEPFVMDAATGQLLDLTNPARAGARLLVLAAGLGQVRPPWPAGVPAPAENPPVTEADVTAYLDGSPLRVVSSTLAAGYVGAYLVEVELPMFLSAGSAELRIEAAGRSSNTVRLYLEP